MDSRIKKHPLGYWEVVDKPTSQALQEYYAEKYYQQAKGSYELSYSEAELRYFQVKLEQRLAVIEQYQPAIAGGSRMLDVGCGEGFALAFFRARGWSIRGLDFSSAGVESQNPDCLDALQTGDLFELLQDEINRGERYDLVWLQNVLEHVLDPLQLLQSLRRLISPRGLAVITVPNDCSDIQLAALESGHIDREFWIAPPDHLSYFSYSSLNNVARETGWSCVEVLADFPIDWFLYHSGSNYVQDRNQGKAAHHARVQIENLVHERPIDDVVRLWSAMAKLGLGRDITAFLRSTEIA